MASYAPLLANVDAWQWTPDAIWFDNLRSYGTPDYYVQKLFASNTGNRVVPSTPQSEAGLYTSAVVDDRSHELILKVVNYARAARKRARSNLAAPLYPEPSKSLPSQPKI